MYYICITTCGANKSGLKTNKGKLITIKSKDFVHFKEHLEIIVKVKSLKEAVKLMDTNLKVKRLYEKHERR